MESTERDILIATEIEPRIKHQTIFDKIDSLRNGECFELINDHDPVPLYYQLIQTRGKENFSWEYLEKGPIDYRILITRLAGANDVDDEFGGIEILNVPSLEPRLKHETIFKKFDSLNAGEEFILFNDHDPMPLYYQLIQTRGEIFDWEYIEKGPVNFRILITKKVNAKKPHSITDDQIEELNATLLEPWVKHATIFQKMEDLEPGDCFILYNDHDPVPLKYQMEERWGKDAFEWEYLEQGPRDFRILITRNEEEKAEEGMREVYELNATLLEPTVKHQTIFQKFDELQPGDAFVLFNDHDPLPLYYQLVQNRGEIFDWEYLERGPVNFRILITKKPVEAKEEINTDGLETFNATEVEHRIRHAEIFKKFDALKPGEGFILKNDHDPKPLYYQLNAERGDIFTWDYIEEGPEWFRIVIRLKTTGQDDTTLGEIAKKGLEKAQVLDQYGLDYTINGDLSLKKACEAKGVDYSTVEKALQEAKKGSINANKQHLQYDEWGIDFLADFILNVHHRFEKGILPDLKSYALKVKNVHGDSHPELAEINDLTQEVADTLETLLMREESILLPHIKEMAKQNGAVPHDHFASLQQPIQILSSHRVAITEDLMRIKALSNDFALPEDACASYTLLYEMLADFSEDFKMQTHLKNNILFPKALELEKNA